MKVQLINAPILNSHNHNAIARGELGETMYPPLGILYIASMLRQRMPQVDIKVTDGLLDGWQSTIQQVKKTGPDIIGISSTTANAMGAYGLSKYLKKKYPDVPVVIGGIHATSLPQDVLSRSKCDMVVMGEGERSFVELVKNFAGKKQHHISNLEKIQGIAFLKKQKLVETPLMPSILNLDEIPFPARDLIDIPKYTGWMVSRASPETSIFSTRGCPFDCHFCSNLVWKLQRPYLRLRSPGNIMDEVEMLAREYGINEYFDHADEINSSANWLMAVCKEKIKRKITIPWKAMLRADNMTTDLAKILAQSGCWYVHLGIETGNQRTIDGVGKRITLEQVISCCKMLKKQGIQICGLFMLFNAWEKSNRLEFEDVAATKNTLRFAEKLLNDRLIDNMTSSQATPYPGSELYNTAIKYKLIPKKYQKNWEHWNHVWSFVMTLPGISEKERMAVKIQGTQLILKNMIRTGNISIKSAPYLFIRFVGLVKRMIWVRAGFRFNKMSS